MQSGSVEASAGRYEATAIEEKWQRAWESGATFDAPPLDERPSSYVLASCPLPARDVDFAHLRSYAIADAYARYRRARGEAVLFSVGFDSAGANGDDGAARSEEAPSRARTQLGRLGCSCDWSRMVDSSRSSQYRWTQWLFLEMLERDIVYEREGRWFMRATSYLAANEDGLEDLSGWNEAAADSQRAAVRKVEGFEVDATILGVGQFPAFTPHADGAKGAAFVAVSPLYPNVDTFAQEPEVAAKLARLIEGAEGAPPVETGLQASVPGVDGLLPVVIWSAVESRYGPTAALGVPERDEDDRAVAGNLRQAASLGGMKLSATSSGKPRPAVRYRSEDIPVSRPPVQGGVALPIVHCDDCGSVPVPRERLPIELAEVPAGDGAPAGLECECPLCHGHARRANGTIDPRLDGMWMWLSICVPPDDRESEMLRHPESQRWLPAAQVVADPDAAKLLFDQRLTAKVLQDLEILEQDAREPFERAFVHETVRVEELQADEYGEGIDDPRHLVEKVGADAVRFALLNAAAPSTAFRWTQTPIRRSQRFLEELWSYAEPRLRDWSGSGTGEIDTSTRLRRRLATWVRVATDKITTSFEQLEMQRGTHNMVLLLTRVRDFEERVAKEGDLDDADRAAIVDSLLLLLCLLAPCAPHICEELWQLGGQGSLVIEAPWPAGSGISSNTRVRSSTG